MTTCGAGMLPMPPTMVAARLIPRSPGRALARRDYHVSQDTVLWRARNRHDDTGSASSHRAPSRAWFLSGRGFTWNRCTGCCLCQTEKSSVSTAFIVANHGAHAGFRVARTSATPPTDDASGQNLTLGTIRTGLLHEVRP